MTEPPRRRWFQLHLSTTIATVMAAGMLLGANLATHQNRRAYDAIKSDDNSRDDLRGWPWPASYKVIVVFSQFSGGHVDHTYNAMPQFSYAALLGNIAIAVGVLISVAAMAEYWARRHE